MKTIRKPSLGETFRIHLNVLAEIFGIHIKMHRQATYELDDENLLWFPNMLEKRVEKWRNEISSNGMEIREFWPNAEGQAKVMRDSHFKRPTFAKVDKTGYTFVGVFECKDIDVKRQCALYTRSRTTL